MNEENSNIDEQSNEEWEAPLPPEHIKTDPQEEPQMSELASLANIFIEPGKTFQDMRRKPRFILAGLIMIVAFSMFNVATIEKLGFENLVKNQIETSSQTQQLSSEQKEQIIEQQSAPLFKWISYAVAPIGIMIFLLIGGLLYWLGSSAFGGSARFFHGVSVWTYSSLPPTLLYVIANLLVLFLKAAEDIDISKAQRGLLQANPAMFIDGKEMPVLAALLSSFDLFAIWGWILAAIGLKFVAKISTGSAWAIVAILALVRITATVVWAAIF